ncbi:hypothetical protein HOY82DRAFT_599387 [Tuber indicum]|nr:hypothetical protein HOY82DRAFT_599387 [Tuber indicum]
MFANLKMQPLYIEVAAIGGCDSAVTIGVVVHDRMYAMDSCIDTLTVMDGGGTRHLVRTDIIAGFGSTPSNIMLRWRIAIDVRELADSAARECVRRFDPNHHQALTSSFRNQVLPDADGAIESVENLKEYQNTAHHGHWDTVYSEAQSAGFRITKTDHNVLPGVTDPEERFDEAKQALLNEWIGAGAKRYSLSPGGPRAPGGEDVRPEVNVIYRSHIDIHSDPVAKSGSPQEAVWKWIWDCVRQADIFISHPMDKFVPNDVPLAMVGLMPACTDWLVPFPFELFSTANRYRLDGLNRPLGEGDLRFYDDNRKNYCDELKIFDPGEGILDVIEGYHKLCICINRDAPEMLPPQLLLHVELSFLWTWAIDDQDALIVYNENIKLLEKPNYAEIAKDVVVVVMRIGPSDQVLNALLTTAKLVVQLSSREGFEVKVSEALHHGKPVVAMRAGGIPLQIEYGKSGFLVEVGDTKSVADHLFDLYTNDDLYTRMSEYPKVSVIDEVGTVGNAVCWLYLAAKLVGHQVLEPNGKWITDMAMAEAGQAYEDGEPRLSRKGINIQ